MGFAKTPAEKLEGEIQLCLSEAWEALQRATDLASNVEFGRTDLRSEWKKKLAALRGCVMLAAAGLIDVRTLEGRAAEKKTPAMRGAEKTIAIMCPRGFPDMSFSLGKVGAWIAAGELQLQSFFGHPPNPDERPTQVKRRKQEDQNERQRKTREALAEQDALIEAVSRAIAVRVAAERAKTDARVAEGARKMRERAGIE